VRVLITGGMGFIGSSFVRLVLAERPEWEVWNLDLLTYAGNPENLEGAVESHVDRSIQSAAPFVRTNLVGTQVLLDAARAHRIARFVHISTDEVYSDLELDDPPFWEQTPLHPSSPYSASKAASDHLVLAYHRTHGMDVVVTRRSNNYGRYQFPEKLTPLMIANALMRELPVYGRGENVRDWIHVEDHCRGVLAALERGAAGDVYNLGGASEHRNIDVVRQIVRVLDVPEELIRFVTDRPGHDRRYAIDFPKAEPDLGWGPARSFEEGLAATVDWYLANRRWWQRVQDGAYRTSAAMIASWAPDPAAAAE
jgi:dTDP-glucose 4,6-dehydratase